MCRRAVAGGPRRLPWLAIGAGRRGDDVACAPPAQPALLDRFSRLTGAVIIPTANHIDKVAPSDAIGTSLDLALGLVRVGHVPCRCVLRPRRLTLEPSLALRLARHVPPVEPTHIPDGRREPPLLPRPPRQPHVRRPHALGQRVPASSVTCHCSANRRVAALHMATAAASRYLVLEGCPPSLGCSVILRGASKQVLRQAKAVLGWAVYVAWCTCPCHTPCANVSHHARVRLQVRRVQSAAGGVVHVRRGGGGVTAPARPVRAVDHRHHDGTGGCALPSCPDCIVCRGAACRCRSRRGN